MRSRTRRSKGLMETSFIIFKHAQKVQPLTFGRWNSLKDTAQPAKCDGLYRTHISDFHLATRIRLGSNTPSLPRLMPPKETTFLSLSTSQIPFTAKQTRRKRPTARTSTFSTHPHSRAHECPVRRRSSKRILVRSLAVPPLTGSSPALPGRREGGWSARSATRLRASAG